MHRSSFTLLLVLATASVSAADNATLFWASGDSLEGQLLSADEQSLTWQTPLFKDPLRIRLPVLAAVRFPDGEAQPTTDPFRVVLRNGDVVTGTLEAVSDATFDFDSRRHGKFQLKRDQIRNLRRIDTPGLFYQGPQGLDGWTRPGSDAEPDEWREEIGGHLATSKSEAAIFRNLSLPETCEIEVVLESTKRPSFMMAFCTDETNSLRLETWDNVLVAVSGLDFVELDTLNSDKRNVQLNLFLDSRAGTLVVYSDVGRKLAEIKGKPTRSEENGLLFRNGDGDLTVSHVRVSEWTGNPPQEVKAGQSRVHLADGSIRYGELSEVSDGEKSLSIAADASVEELVIDQISTIIVNDDSERSAERPPTRVIWDNGSVVSGDILRIGDGTVVVRTDYSVEPLVSTMNGMRRISLPSSETPSAQPDQVFFDGGALKGSLSIENGEKDPIRWKPVGGLNASVLAGTGDARFLRGAKATEVTFDQQAFPDTIYLTNDDVLPCRLEASSEDRVRIRSPLAEVREIAAEHVKAVEFSSTGRALQKGFGGDNWKRVSGSAKIADDKITFSAAGAVGHGGVLTGDTVQFQLEWKSPTVLSLELFTDDLKLNSKTATTLILSCNGNQVSVSDQSVTEQELIRGAFIAAQAADQKPVRADDRKANVQLTARDGQLHVSINGNHVQSIRLNPQGAGAKGMVIRSMLTSGQQRVLGFQGRVSDGSGALEISNFRVLNRGGASVRAFIDEEVRDLTLTVPRFRRDDPFTHILLAPNGDLLRGRLLRVNENEVTFESRLEEFRFPRERVAAIIWLGPVAEPEEAAADDDAATADVQSSDESPFAEVTPDNHNEPTIEPANVKSRGGVQAILDKGFMLTMTPEKAVDGKLIGHSEALGRCEIAGSAIRELFVGNPESRQQIVTYTRWVPKHAMEPDWDIPDSGGTVSPLIGQEIPDFELPTLEGDTFRLSDHANKVVVLDFWATWCGPCVMALPEYIKATSAFDESQVIFVAVNLQEDPTRIRKFQEEQNLSPLVALDRSSDVAQQFGVAGIPHSVILGPGNVVESVHVGYRAGISDEFQDIIQQILDGSWERPGVE